MVQRKRASENIFYLLRKNTEELVRISEIPQDGCGGRKRAYTHYSDVFAKTKDMEDSTMEAIKERLSASDSALEDHDANADGVTNIEPEEVPGNQEEPQQKPVVPPFGEPSHNQAGMDDSRLGNGYDIPSRRLSLLVEGRDYLKYRETFERMLFAERMTQAQKDTRILQLALACLVERVNTLSAETGEPFVKAEMLAG